MDRLLPAANPQNTGWMSILNLPWMGAGTFSPQLIPREVAYAAPGAVLVWRWIAGLQKLEAVQGSNGVWYIKVYLTEANQGSIFALGGAKEGWVAWDGIDDPGWGWLWR